MSKDLNDTINVMTTSAYTWGNMVDTDLLISALTHSLTHTITCANLPELQVPKLTINREHIVFQRLSATFWVRIRCIQT